MKFLDYIQGVRRGKDAHRIEKEAMNDPFLSAAIEGYDSISGNHTDRIARMQASIFARTTEHKTRSGAWKIAVAAVAVIALLSGYFALMNHQSSMALALETEKSYINLYAPEVYIEQKRLELTAMMENNPSQDILVESVVPISNLDDVIKPIEVLPLYVPGTYAEQMRNESDDKPSENDGVKKIFVTDASSSILAEAKVPVPQSNNTVSEMPEKLRDAWTTKEVTEVTRSRTVELNKNGARGKGDRMMRVAVSEDPKKSTQKETEATNIPRVDSHEARLLAEQAGFEKIEVVGADELNGNALELNEVESSKRNVTRESFYRPKAGARSLTEPTQRVQPEPLIGHKEYKKYLKENLIRPQDDDCKNVKGKVVMQISVDKDGTPVNIIVTKGLCRSLDKEAVRLVKQGPKWKYGTLRTNVEVQF